MSASHPFQQIWIFSDLHLSSPDSPLYRSFLDTLNEPQSAADAVVFAGDIFDLFVGNSSYFIHKHSEFLNALQRLSAKGVSLYYIQGNHDFHLDRAFEGLSVKILDSELILGKIYIAHGDLVDQEDRGYLILRKLFRSSFIQHLSHLLPGGIVKMIGESMSRSHDQKQKDLAKTYSEAPPVRKIFRQFAEQKKAEGFEFVILGHCHDFDDLNPFYFNMGYPPVHRQYLHWSADSNSVKRRKFTGI
jgi:UDP-2,3-diacylglucosamine hydrolase